MDEAARREKKLWQDRQRMAAREAFPLSDEDLRALFTDVDERLGKTPCCDHSLRFTLGWLMSKGHSADPVVGWLGVHGGFCDCEVVANCRDHWEQNRSRTEASQVVLRVELLSTAEGGRASPACMQGGKWRPHLRVPPSQELLGVAFLEGPEVVEPGARCVATATLLYVSRGQSYSGIEPGASVEIVEGARLVGRARVVRRD